MDIGTALTQLKQEPGFADHVGMVLIHNGVVRGFSRKDNKKVTSITVQADLEKIKSICQKFEQQPGIFRIVAHANSGTFKPGDDLLYLIVAGDVRENVKRTLSELLDTIKQEAVCKQEALLD